MECCKGYLCIILFVTSVLHLHEVAPAQLSATGWYSSTVNDNSCFDGFTYDPYIRICVFISTVPTTKEKAEQICKQMTFNIGSLYLPKNPQTAHEVHANSAGKYTPSGEFWTGMYFKDSKLYWSDGTTVDYARWTAGPVTAADQCVVLFNGRWKVYPCTENKHYICQHHVFQCPADFIYDPASESCFYASGSMAIANRATAKTKCEAMGYGKAHLGYIKTKSIFEFVANEVHKYTHDYDYFWIGMDPVGTTDFIWLDNTLANGTKWEQAFTSSDVYVQMKWNTDGFKGHDDTVGIPYLCQFTPDLRENVASIWKGASCITTSIYDDVKLQCTSALDGNTTTGRYIISTFQAIILQVQFDQEYVISQLFFMRSKAIKNQVIKVSLENTDTKTTIVQSQISAMPATVMLRDIWDEVTFTPTKAKNIKLKISLPNGPISSDWGLMEAKVMGYKENEPITCERLQRLGYGSGTFRLDMDGSGRPLKPFPAYCDMSNSATKLPSSLLDNRLSEVDGKITCTAASSCVTPKDHNFKHFFSNTNFGGGDQTFKGLLEHSYHCSQYLRMKDCNNVGVVTQQGASMSHWKTSDGLSMKFWPGGSYGGGCACKLKSTCSSGSICNCNEATTGEDAGEYYGSWSLPMSAVTLLSTKTSYDTGLSASAVTCYHTDSLCAAIGTTQRYPCGSSGITKSQCEESECCYDSATSQCFAKYAGAIPTDCEVLRRRGYPNGLYVIDVDGPGGARPMKVECSMETIPASATVGLSTPFIGTLQTCSTPGCNAVDFTYKATLHQMKALTQASQHCTQMLGIACQTAPIWNALANTSNIWWHDVNGNKMSYWTGNNSHRCACGMYNSCILTNVTCNCDAGLSEMVTDDGILTDKNNLPVTRIRTSGKVSVPLVGPLICQPPPCSPIMEVGSKLWPTNSFTAQTPQGAGKLYIFEEPAFLISGKLKAWHFIAKSRGAITLVILEQKPNGYHLKKRYGLRECQVGLNRLLIPTSEVVNVTLNDVIGYYSISQTGAQLAYDNTKGSDAYELSLSNLANGPFTGTKMATPATPAMRIEIDTGIQWLYDEEIKKCFHLPTDKFGSAKEANSHCESLGGNAVAVDSKTRNAKLNGFINEPTLFVGIDSTNDYYAWVDLSPVAYTNFSTVSGRRKSIACSGESIFLDCRPEHVIRVLWANYGRTSSRMCMATNSFEKTVCITEPALLKVSDTCHGNQNCSLTATAADFSSSCLTTSSYLEVHYDCLNVTACPSGYSDYFQGSCYMVLPDQKQQSDQIKGCANKEGYLAEIDNPEEFEHVHQIFNRTGAHQFHMGYKEDSGSYWGVTSGRKLQLPAAYVTGSSASCLVLHEAQKKLLKFDCAQTKRALCEKKVILIEDVALKIGFQNPTMSKIAPSSTHKTFCQKNIQMDSELQCLTVYERGSSIQCPQERSDMVRCYCPCLNSPGRIDKATGTCSCGCNVMNHIVSASCCTPFIENGRAREMELDCLPHAVNPPGPLGECPSNHSTAVSCYLNDEKHGNIYQRYCLMPDKLVTTMVCCRTVDKPGYDGVGSAALLFKTHTTTGALDASTADWRVSAGSVDRCMMTCAQKPACKYLVFKASSGVCYMADSSADVQSSGSDTVYKKKRDQTDLFTAKSTWTSDSALGLYARELNAIPIGHMDLETCARACIETSGCKSISLTNTSICYTSMYSKLKCTLLTQNSSSHILVRASNNGTLPSMESHWSVKCSSHNGTGISLTCPEGKIVSCKCTTGLGLFTPSSPTCSCQNPNGIPNIRCCKYVLQYVQNPEVCSPGTIVNDQKVCQACANGTVSSNLNGLKCEPCPDGYVPDKWKSYCALCPKNSTINANKTGCDKCPACQVTDGDGMTPCKPINCGTNATNITYATYTPGNTSYPNNLTYTCDKGYVSNKTIMAQCQCNGTWTQPVGVCEPLSCGSPPDLGNGTKNGTNFTLNAVVKYTCNDGYELKGGADYFTCSCHGNWTGDNITCAEIDECKSNPCQNGATCVDKINNFTCTCAAGFNGTLCENNIDECKLGHKCKNGTCQDAVNNYTCNCNPGFTGFYCDVEIDECASDPCQNGGTCKDQVNSFVCSCTPLYSGNKCEYRLNENECLKTPAPCLHGGTCADKTIGYNCTCVAGYSGISCETDIDECASNPCLNHGTCTDAVNSFSCACATGFTGPLCQTDIDDCAPKPCLNGGNCTDKTNGYSCSCAPGFNGSNCQTNIDDCASKPCLNGGTCKDGVNQYTCTCTSSFTGQVCETDVLPCTANPCQNGATCGNVNKVDKCVCLPGYIQPVCNPKDCGQPPTVPGASFSAPTTTYKSVATYSCSAGFTKAPASPVGSKTCNTTGSWAGSTISCVFAAATPPTDTRVTPVPATNVLPECPPAIDIALAKRNIDSLSVGSKITYTCTAGYWFYGKRLTTVTIECLYNGQWDIDMNTQKCVKLLCPQITLPANTLALDYSRDYGTVVTYMCFIGHRFIDGTTIRTTECLTSGSWSNPMGPCTATPCPPIVTNAVSVTDTAMPGEKLLTCKAPALFAHGSPISTNVCTPKRVWANDYFKCDVGCPAVPFVLNATISTRITRPNTEVVVTCMISHRFSTGESQMGLKCTPGLDWNTTLPAACQPVFCPTAPKVLNAIADTKEVRVGTTVTYRCTYGYRFTDNWNTSRIIRCLETIKWSEIPPACEEIHCGVPPNITRATRTYKADTLDATVVYNCTLPTHRFLEGQDWKIGKCLSTSKWKAINDTCEPDRCYPPPALKTATPSTINADFGSVVTYTCQEGYVFPDLKPTTSITCLKSTNWSRKPPECQAVNCPSLANISNLIYNTSTKAMYNSIVNITCKTGYIFNDTTRVKNIKCLATAKWNVSSSSYTCQEVKCPDTRLVRYGWRSTTKTKYRTQLFILCRVGFFLSPKLFWSDHYCLADGTWSTPVETECKPVTCTGVPDWNAIFNSTENHASAVVNYTCPNGTTFADRATVKTSTCLINGNWFPPFQECVAGNRTAVSIPVTEASGSTGIGALAIALLSTVLLLMVVLDIATLGKDIALCRR